MCEQVLENLAPFQMNGSYWSFHSIVALDVFTVKYFPSFGSYAPLPRWLPSKNAIVKMKNSDNQCFKWCVERALNPVERDPERIAKMLRKQSKTLTFTG